MRIHATCPLLVRNARVATLSVCKITRFDHHAGKLAGWCLKEEEMRAT